MTAGLGRKLWLVWALLVGVTIVSWIVGGTSGGTEPFQRSHLITISVLLMAAVKVVLIMRYFMELEHAPRKWKALPFAWIAILLAILAGIYFGEIGLEV